MIFTPNIAEKLLHPFHERGSKNGLKHEEIDIFRFRSLYYVQRNIGSKRPFQEGFRHTVCTDTVIMYVELFRSLALRLVSLRAKGRIEPDLLRHVPVAKIQEMKHKGSIVFQFCSFTSSYQLEQIFLFFNGAGKKGR